MPPSDGTYRQHMTDIQDYFLVKYKGVSEEELEKETFVEWVKKNAMYIIIVIGVMWKFGIFNYLMKGFDTWLQIVVYVLVVLKLGFDQVDDNLMWEGKHMKEEDLFFQNRGVILVDAIFAAEMVMISRKYYHSEDEK